MKVWEKKEGTKGKGGGSGSGVSHFIKTLTLMDCLSGKEKKKRKESSIE